MFYYLNLMLALLWIILARLSYDSLLFCINTVMAVLWLVVSVISVFNYRRSGYVDKSLNKMISLMSAAASIIMTVNTFESFRGFQFYIMLIICSAWICISWCNLYNKLDA